MELHASVGRLEHRQLVLWEGRAILGHIGLQPPSRCWRAGLDWLAVQIRGIRTGGDEGELKFGGVAGQVGEQPMINDAGVTVASRWLARLRTLVRAAALTRSHSAGG